ncbi:NAD(P)/FAD-dependent oxidoreductase [Streptomyces qinzhouensis]|uniref:NAD(P)/FAD-dependent oxidoreductase n=1 Tax=Streptomyces qinzhouensis TaxID=2599401 RepID=A0A5B8JB99_9ACTN|nr:NAD(P)/FAD-dependent oxidoreductase [Streptomyces qinzhouensis]QDY79095.1 NAD(P)/FAD-dependent oxidoreductase [Streptomyces qinzhouensis]
MGATNGTAGEDPNRPGYDVIVVGAGAAGLSAALVLGRARRRVAVVDSGTPRNAPAAHMHGFLSRDGMPPAELTAVGRAEVAGYGVTVFDALADGITTDGDVFRVRLAGGAALTARRVLVATGLRDELPALPGVRERWGRDVLHCPYCHGYEVRDAPLGVLGTGPGAVHQALMVRQWSPDVVLFAQGLDPDPEQREQLAARGVRVEETPVKRLVVADDALRGVELTDGRVVPRTAVFVAPRMVPRDGLLAGPEWVRDETTGALVTDATGRTSVAGVWAVGNVTDPRAQVPVAVGAGAAAAMDINNGLVAEDVARAVAAARAVSATTGA